MWLTGSPALPICMHGPATLNRVGRRVKGVRRRSAGHAAAGSHCGSAATAALEPLEHLVDLLGPIVSGGMT